MNALEKFENIKQKLISTEDGVHDGKMMRAPGIKYNGKVFSFFAKNGSMVFKLGKELNPETSKYPFIPFNPFKNKGPLAGWFELSADLQDQWEEIAYESLKHIKS